jgi:hypothetical protein
MMVDRLLSRAPFWRAVVLLAVLLRVAFIVAPFDVLHPVDAHDLGRRLLDGQMPYRDFGLEYPPGALLGFLLPGLAPSSIAPQVVALQALAMDGLIMLLMRSSQERFRRYVLLSTILFPLMSGGFDAIAMACIAWSTTLIGRDDRRGWWVASLGAAVKIFPGVAWGWARRWGRTGTVALGVAVAVLLVPLALGEGRDVYVRYHLDRGVQQESLAASATYLVGRVTGEPIEISYRFRAQEVVGAETLGTVLLVVFGLAACALAVRCRRRSDPLDPWLSSLAVLAVVLCGSKVLSPQFMLLAAPAAAQLGGRIYDAYLAIAVLSILAFTDDGKADTFMTVVALRNLVFLAVAVGASWMVLRPPAATGSRDPAVSADLQAT